MARSPTEIDAYSGLPRSDAVKFAWCRGALFATGPAIDAIAAALGDAVPPACRAARERRDGASHHITLIPKIEASDAWNKLGQGRRARRGSRDLEVYNDAAVTPGPAMKNGMRMSCS